ncbi:MAG: fibronectin type III domain-containing protein [Ilumatobacter sp.]
MLKRSIVAACIAVAALAAPAVSTTGPIQAAGADQISVWDTTLSQTYDSYWEPALNQPADYTGPRDYASGTAYIKIDVLEKPSDLAMIPLICFWTHTAAQKFKYETCARKGVDRIFTDEGTYYFDLKAPESWWQKNGVFDWSTPPTLGRIMLKKAYSETTELMLGKLCGSFCYKGDDLEDHIPVRIASELIFVAQGETLNPPSDWRNECPSDWANACSGDGGDPTGPTTTAPVATPAPTLPPGTGIDVTAARTSLQVAHRLDNAVLHQVRWRLADKNKLSWNTPTDDFQTTISGLDPGTTYVVQVRGLINKKWRAWNTTSATTTGGSTTTTAPATTAPATTAPATTAATTAPPTTAAPTTAPPPGPGSDSVDATSTRPAVSATGANRVLRAEWFHPRAELYQYRYNYLDRTNRVWSDVTAAQSAVIGNLDAGVTYQFQVRGFIDGKWQKWASVKVGV